MELNILVQAHTPSTVVLAMEATGNYGENLAAFAFHTGWTVFVINPARIKAFSIAAGQRNKTDREDCLTIGLFVQSSPKLTPWVPLSEAKAELRHCVRERLHVQQLLQAEEARLLTTGSTEFIKKRIELLKTQKHDLAQRITAVIKKDETLARAKKLLSSIPGIGAWTAAVLLSELPPIDAKTKSREVASLFGLCPRILQSGTSIAKAGSVTGHGRKIVSHQLYMPALVALKHNPQIQTWAQRLKERHKRPKQIIAAVIDRLLRSAVGVLKTQTEFQPNRPQHA
jgi:transposase